MLIIYILLGLPWLFFTLNGKLWRKITEINYGKKVNKEIINPIQNFFRDAMCDCPILEQKAKEPDEDKKVEEDDLL